MKIAKRLRSAWDAFLGGGPFGFYGSGYAQEGVPLTGTGFDQLMAANIQHVAKCVGMVTVACAATKLRLFVKTKTTGPKNLNFPHRAVSKAVKERIYEEKSWASDAGDIEEITDHPILWVLRNVNNGNDNPMDLYSYIVSQYLLVGNSFVQKARGPGNLPIGINTSDPANWSIVPGPDNTIKQYEYREGAKKQIYTPEDVLHFKLPDPRAGYMGIGILIKCLDSYNTDVAIRKFEQNTFRKGGWITGLFKLDERAGNSETELRAMAAKIRQDYGGTEANKIGVFKGVEFQQLGQTLKDLNHILGRKLTRNEICNAFDVPEALVELNAANLASAREARMMFAEYGVWPRLRMMEEELNADLVGEFGDNLMLMFDSPMPNDAVEERNDVIAYIDRGVWTRNEVRERMGLPPVPYEETFPGERGGGGFGIMEPAPEEDESPGESEDQGDGKSKAVTPEEESKISRAAYWKAFDRKLRRHEMIIEKKAKELLDKMWGQVLENMSGKKGVDMNEIDSWLYDEDEFAELFGEELYPPVEATFLAGANAQGLIDFNLDSPRATDELGKMENRIRDIPNDRWENIRSELINGMENGETLTELRNRVMAARGNDDRYGAERIARTEAAGAYNAGHYEATMQDTFSWGSEWITTIDGNERDTHNAIDGDKAQKGERFANGLLYPGEAGAPAEEVINCRCTIRAVDKDV